MRDVILPILVAACLTACAEMVEFREVRRGPVPEVGAIQRAAGHVRYALRGPKSVVRRRKKSAYKKMAKACGGEKLFRVKKQYTSEDAETSYKAEDLDADRIISDEHYKVESYRHILFECAEAR